MQKRYILPVLVYLVLPDALEAKPTYDSAAPIAYMVDLSSGAVLVDKQSKKRIPPASMAKMLSTYVIFDMVKSGELSLDRKLTLKKESWEKWRGVGSTMFLQPNEPTEVRALLQGMITLSGNDAAIALAEGLAGSEQAFVKLMNAKALTLGMKDSLFATANGWPDGNKTLTTAQDLAIVARRTLWDHPKLYREFYGKPEFRWNGVTQADRNPILGSIKGADGLKTGHTSDAGYCFAGTAQQDGRRLLMIVAGLPTYESRITESNRLMKWGFSEWRSVPLYKAGVFKGQVRVQMGDVSTIIVSNPSAVAVTLPTTETTRYSAKIRYKGPVKAPFAKGSHIADLVVKLKDGSEQVTPLLASQTVNRAGFLGRAWNGLKSVFGA